MATIQAKGFFEVKLNPEPLSSVAADTGLSRMSLDKSFTGDLEAVSKGEMLAYRDSALGSGGYVAMEVVSGKLGGRAGTFILQHSSTMSHGAPTQSVTVVPDSGTGDLKGLTGSLVISMSDGKHAYTFEYTPAE
jgi:hypothetical protein